MVRRRSQDSKHEDLDGMQHLLEITMLKLAFGSIIICTHVEGTSLSAVWFLYDDGPCGLELQPILIQLDVGCSVLGHLVLGLRSAEWVGTAHFSSCLLRWRLVTVFFRLSACVCCLAMFPASNSACLSAASAEYMCILPFCVSVLRFHEVQPSGGPQHNSSWVLSFGFFFSSYLYLPACICYQPMFCTVSLYRL